MTVKQNSLQSAFAFLSKTQLWIGVCFFCTAATFAQTPMPQVIQRETRLQLLSGPALHDDTYDAGIKITMPPGSHTYWKMPGDAGVPPVFAFNGSQNLRSAKVLFPAPHRITEEGLEAFGYSDQAIFPVVATPADPAKPAVLHTEVDYAVCNKICVPEHGTANLTLEPRGGPRGDAEAVEAALAAVPVPASPPQRAELSIAPLPEAPKPSWTLTWHGTGAVEDIFADAPEGYYFATRKRGPTTWTLTADQMVHAPDTKTVPVELTLARSSRSLVVEETLDTQSATR